MENQTVDEPMEIDDENILGEVCILIWLYE